MSEPKLTEAEIAMLDDAEGWVMDDGAHRNAAVEAILAARLAPVEAELRHWTDIATDEQVARQNAETERDEARANRDRLAHENAALRRQVADLTATSRVLPCDGDCMEYAEECCSLHGRTPADLWRMLAEQNARVETLTAERDGIRGEHAGGSHMSQAEWADWSNELAQLLPEQYHDDVAQEAIITGALADLVRRTEAAERALAAGLALAEQWRGRHDLVMTGDSAAHDLTAALVSAPLLSSTAPSENSGPGVPADSHAPQPRRFDPATLNHDICPKCREWKFIGHGPLCVDCFTTPPATDAEEANEA